MADNVNIHANGSWLGDASEQFKKLPKGGKLAIVGVVLLVAGIAYYEYRKNAGASASVSPMPAASMTSGNQSPFPMINGQPLLPSGTNPILDGNGNVIGYQGPPAPSSNPFPLPNPLPPPTPIQPPHPNPTVPPPMPKVNTIPLVPDNLKVWFGKGNVLYQGTDVNHQSVVNLPANTGVRAGSDGRYWVFTKDGTQQLITNKFYSKPPG